MAQTSGFGASVHRLALQGFRVLPALVRRNIVRAVQPKYTVGAICIVERSDGRMLLVRHSYRNRWGTPGGLCDRREHPEAAAVRECLEEVALPIEVVGEPLVVVEPRYQRVDVVISARPAAGVDPDSARPNSAEIAECRWFDPTDLPSLQSETATAMVTRDRFRAAELDGGSDSRRRPRTPVAERGTDLR